MPEKRQAVRLTTAERDVLEKFVAHGTKSARAITRARILLRLDEGRREKELTTILGVSRGTTHVQGVSAIRSLEMALQPGMRGRDRQVFDNLEAVEVRFLSP